MIENSAVAELRNPSNLPVSAASQHAANTALHLAGDVAVRAAAHVAAAVAAAAGGAVEDEAQIPAVEQDGRGGGHVPVADPPREDPAPEVCCVCMEEFSEDNPARHLVVVPNPPEPADPELNGLMRCGHALCSSFLGRLIYFGARVSNSSPTIPL